MTRKSKDTTRVETPVGNYYGNLTVRLYNGKPQWAVENYSGFDWEPCPQSIYDAIVAEYGEVK